MIILITGASSGIGKMTAEHLTQRGYRVFGTSRQSQPNPEFEMLRLNLHSDASVQACVESVIEKAGRIDVLINNAGTDMLGAAEEATLEQIKALFETNVFGTMRMVNAVLPYMRGQGSGKIINLSSGLGMIGAPMQGIYAASKHAVEGYSESLWYELKPFRIHVSMVQPSFYKTDLASSNTTFTEENPAYATMRRKLYPAWRRYVDRAPTPETVAHTIQRIIQTKNPRLRYPVGLESVFTYWLADAVPFALLARVVRLVFRV